MLSSYCQAEPQTRWLLSTSALVFPLNPSNHLTTHTSVNLASDDMTAKSKVVYLVELDLFVPSPTVYPNRAQNSPLASAGQSLAQLSRSLF